MSLLLSEKLGRQEPRVLSLPGVADAGLSAVRADEMIDVAGLAGLVLEPWQVHAAAGATRVDSDDRWCAFEVGVQANRQNGKGSIVEARQIAGLFVWGEKFQIHTAHWFPTAQAHFRRVLELIESTPSLDRLVQRVSRADGEEAIETREGTVLRFIARSLKSGRGLTADVLYLDEAFAVKQQMMASLAPVVSSKTVSGNPQIWYASSAGGPESEVFAAVRARGLAGDDSSLAWMEWSVPDDADPDDPESWRLGNPAFGVRKSEDYFRSMRSAMADEQFRQEELGVWPATGGEEVFPGWADCADPVMAEARESGKRVDQSLQSTSLAVDVPPDRSVASVVACGTRPDGSLFVEVLDRRDGTEWVAPYVREVTEAIAAKGSRAPVYALGSGAVSALEQDFKRHRVRVMVMGDREYAGACGAFYDLVEQRRVSHSSQPELSAAVDAAKRKSMGDSLWKLVRQNTVSDISPLVAAILAVAGERKRKPKSDGGRKRRGSIFA